MRSFILIIFVMFATNTSKSQTVKYSGKDNMQLYSLAINNLIKTSPHEKFFPKSLLISGGILSYLSDFLSEPTEANNIKKYIVDNNWDYFNKIDLKKFAKKSEELKIKYLKPILAKDQLIKKNLPFYYTFSPIIFSQDNNRGILVFVRHGETETHSILIYYFIRNLGDWHLANVQMPYLI